MDCCRIYWQYDYTAVYYLYWKCSKHVIHITNACCTCFVYLLFRHLHNVKYSIYAHLSKNINKRKVIIITYQTNLCIIIWCNIIWYYSCDTEYSVSCRQYKACLPVKVVPHVHNRFSTQLCGVVSICQSIYMTDISHYWITCVTIWPAGIHVVTANVSYMYVTIHYYSIKFGRSLYIWIIWTSYILAMRIYYLNPFIGLLMQHLYKGKGDKCE